MPSIKTQFSPESKNNNILDTPENRNVIQNISNGVRFLILVVFVILVFGQILVIKQPVIAAPTSEIIWSTSQACDFEITNPERSLDGSSQGFDDETAACQWETLEKDSAWFFENFQPTSFIQISDVRLEIAFFLEQWKPDYIFELQASNNGGVDWHRLEIWDTNNSPEDNLKLNTYDVSDIFNTPSDLNMAQVRFWVPIQADVKTEFVIYVDAVSFSVSGSLNPTETSTITATASITNTPVTTVEPTTVVVTETATSTFITPTTTETTSPFLTETITPTVTETPTISATPTSTSTPFPTLTLDDKNAQVQVLWGVAQSCDFKIDNPSGSIDLSFNDQTATCTGEFAKDYLGWEMTKIQHTTFTHINDIVMDVRFKQTGWIDDQINLEIFDGRNWHILIQFGPGKSIPPAELTTFSFNVNNILNSPELINQAAVRFVGTAANETSETINLTVDETSLRVAGGFEPSLSFAPIPLSGGSLNLNNAVPSNGSPHGDQTLLTDSCAACHRSHTGGGTALRETWPEETVCFSCHSSAGPGTNIQPSFTNYTNTPTRIFTHAVMFTNGIHRLDQTSGSDFGGGNRHVECEDCHDPHYAARGSTSAPVLQIEMAKVSGVDPVWTGIGAPSSYVWLSDANTEYQVCFKCHSSFTNLPNYVPDGWNGSGYVSNGLPKLTGSGSQQVADSRDMAREFNPYQASFHPVAAQGRNQNIPASSFVNGWSQSSLVYCTDCHQTPIAVNGGVGPHGSPMLHLLKGQANYSTVLSNGSPRVSSSELCFQCHSYRVYVTGQDEVSNFKEHKKHMDNDWGTTCYTCHDTHGSEQQHLINMDASVMTFLNGRNSQTAWYYDPVSGKAGCYVSCHGKLHEPKEYEP